MRAKIKEIIKILSEHSNLPCGGECKVRGNLMTLCYDEITDHGKTCMLRGRDIAIQKLIELDKEQSEELSLKYGNKLARIEDFINNQYNKLENEGKIILDIINEK